MDFDEELEDEPTSYESSRPTKMVASGGEVVAVSTRKTTCRYRECLKNHAVNIGGHAVDGCGEFMAAGEEGSLDALKCAACNCHRNFHRKEIEGEGFHHHPSFTPYSGYRAPGHGGSGTYLHVSARPLALPSISGGGGNNTSRDDQDEDNSNPTSSGGLSSRKRFRTKFSQEQKDKMLSFAEKLGWRIQKHDEAAVQQFCNETGVKRHVLKVWMHNNKHTLGKKP
ncbi:hypothetical protein MKW94_027081 [Papaver nudicaule]|uniref:ZF-HD dimerization-type domain-containing protein n=1 Tax=Papaver nudicaule TaxID=74823 RepID=A0AA41UX27_PAPNU|nr:hypothetical protein [Papaver nudicaule]